MRKVIFGGANSLDNFIAREDGAVDSLLWSDEVTEIMNDFWPQMIHHNGRKNLALRCKAHQKEREKSRRIRTAILKPSSFLGL